MRPWILPALCALVVFCGFVIPGSEQAGPALGLSALVALTCAAVWVVPLKEHPPLMQRKAIWPLLISFGILLLVLSVLPVISLMTEKAGGFGGLYDPSSAWLEYIKLGGVFCAFALGLRVSMTSDGGRKLFDAMLVMGGVWALVCIIMHINDPDGVYGVAKLGAGRLTGAFSSPNSAGTLFGAVSVMALGRIISRYQSLRVRNPIERIDPLYAAICLLALGALMLTVSRAAIGVTVVCLVGLTLVLLRRRLSFWAGLVVVICLIGAGFLLFAGTFGAVAERLVHLDADMDIRAAIFQAHYEVASKQPLFGFGLGSFDVINATIVSESTYRELAVIRAAHNVYLQWFEETGLTALAALIAVNLAVLIPMVRAVLRDVSTAPRLVIIMGAYLVFLLHGLTDYALQEMALTLFVAMMLGSGFAMASNLSQKQMQALKRAIDEASAEKEPE